MNNLTRKKICNNPIERVLREFDDFGREFDNLSHFFGLSPFKGVTSASYVPALEMTEEKNQYVIIIEIPGVNKEDTSITLTDDNTLVLKGEKKSVKKEEDSETYFSEVSYGSFRRELSLPKNINKDKIDASWKNGILKIILPKEVETEVKIKQIEIKTEE
ncbi:MAG TPA: Hsp20/alpha crystallin family protein [Candidatus Paceibacterota bacterium]|nr:Hsp20/alpha crystallin family protein [Candidatus Paceibacterota bacterium]